MSKKTMAAMQEEILRMARELTPAELVQVLDHAISDLQAQGFPASGLQLIQDGRAKLAALAS